MAYYPVSWTFYSDVNGRVLVGALVRTSVPSGTNHLELGSMPEFLAFMH